MDAFSEPDSYEPYTPEFRSPYPDDWSEVGGFEYLTHLHLTRAKTAIRDGEGREAEYIVADDFACRCKVDGRDWPICVPSGMLTDLTSSPWIARLLVERVGPHLEAAIVHDFLFIAWQDLDGHGVRKRDFHFANQVMLQAMKASGVRFLQRNAIYLAVSSPVAWVTYYVENKLPRYVRRRWLSEHEMDLAA